MRSVFGYYNTFETITVGGRVELSGRNEDAYTKLTVTDTLYVDCGCLANGVTPALTKRITSNYSGIKFNTGSKIEIKDWSALPKGRRIVALDLSGVVSSLSGEGVVGAPTVVPSDEGVLMWDAAEKKLYARRHSDGFFMIFK